MRQLEFGAESYVWTNRGLLKGYELRKGYEVLGNTYSDDVDFESLDGLDESYNVVSIIFDSKLNYQEMHLK